MGAVKEGVAPEIGILPADSWIIYRNKIPVDLVKAAIDIPKMNPLGLKYTRWWKEQKRRCIEGHWVSYRKEHKFVPGPLYFYVNFWKILLNPKNSKSKQKKTGIPFLRDIDWLKGFVYDEARGFSGFSEDGEVTCHRILKGIDPENNEEDREEFNMRLMEFGSKKLVMDCITKADGTFKEYVEARVYLRGYFSGELGKPQYLNMAQNVCDLEARGGGKSYWKAGICAHNFLFDGATDYDDYLSFKADEMPLSSETLIGAIDAKYSSGLIAKIKSGLSKLPGEEVVGEDIYPAPFSRKYTGSWDASKTIVTGFDKKVGGVWKKFTTDTMIHHRSFGNNPLAGNGTRPGLTVLDEIGFFNILVETLGQMKEAAADGSVKQGVIWMTGTGGDMDGGSTEAVKVVFYNPATYDCLGFKDEFESYSDDIGLFIPAFLTLNQFKDELGNTDYVSAIKYLNRKRAFLKKNAKKKKSYNDELVQRPMKHSEVFLSSQSTLIPVIELKEHYDYLCSLGNVPEVTGLHGWMVTNDFGEAKFRLDPDEYKPTDYPVNQLDDNRGAVVIWEQPDPNAEYGWYVGGNDPYDFDEAPNSLSLGSVLLFKRGTAMNGGVDRLVAEYTGRPGLASEFYEQVRLLLKYFGDAICLYENEKQMIKDHFKKNYSLYLLATTPGVLKGNENSKTARVRNYGQHMSTTVKLECEIYLRDWLLKPIGDNRFQYQEIKSLPLLKELISYNREGNFDRVIALMLAIIQMAQMSPIATTEGLDHNGKSHTSAGEGEDEEVDFFDRKLFVN